jgi:hypothetical protein
MKQISRVALESTWYNLQFLLTSSKESLQTLIFNAFLCLSLLLLALSSSSGISEVDLKSGVSLGNDRVYIYLLYFGGGRSFGNVLMRGKGVGLGGSWFEV